MKSKVLMIVALFFSGAAFAQQASIQTSGNTTVTKQQSTVSGSSSNSAGANVTAPQGSTGMDASQSGEATINTNAIKDAGGTATGHVREKAQTITAIAVQQGQTTIKTVADHAVKVEGGVIKTAANVRAVGQQAIKVAPVPIRVNTRITGGAALGIL
ncbi:hypothetical protein ACTJJ0_28970 [Chitinophaga sp. 22321]|uniref:Uncharacterized protein n=1 Tax=Chitinophaga hostae TaxID=2831022 RepID=A0ABS5J7G9_9BACT|nr:hypothetical protein [Chitinophaga hostae]MBS0031026.1 hypothetical protein [Chitinophaga hostae]